MKKNLFPMVAAMAILGFAACNDSAETTETTTDSSASSQMSNSSSMETTTDMGMDPDPTASYIELKTGKSVKLRRDTVTRYIVNETSNEPVWYYVNTATSDTFDRSGRVVNNALIKGTDGDWTVDESRIKVKTQDDGDVKMKDRDSDTKVKLETDGDGKIKTDTSKIKIRDGKVKEKKTN